MPILCSKCPKMGVSKAKSAQRPRFCAREERGVGNSSAQTVDDHVLVNGRTRKRSAAGGWSEAEVCAEEVADPRKPMRLQRGRPCRSAGVLRGELPLRSAVHCCRCEALDLTEREQTHKKEDDHCGHPHTEKINWISAIWLRGCQGSRPGRSGLESGLGRKAGRAGIG